MDVAYDIARSIAKTRYEDLPADVIESTKKSVLDLFGVTLAASTLGQGCTEVVDLVKESSARGKSTILGYGGRVPAWLAGFANGSMTHQLDYDDVFDEALVHPGSCTVPTAFALGEEMGADGKKVITAIAVSIDLVARLGLSTIQAKDSFRDFHNAPVLGTFAATAAAGKMLDLDEEGLLYAFGHNLQQAAGTRQYMFSPGGIFRGIRDGFSIKSGMLSALLAKKGLPGTKDSLESRAGLFNLYYRGAYDRSYLTNELGKTFEGVRVGFKPWPACRGTHASIDATLAIIGERNIRPEDIERIDVMVPDFARFLIEPLESRRQPETIIDAKQSIPFAIGVAVSRRKVLIKDYTLEGLKDPAALSIAQKVHPRVDNDLKGSVQATVVEITVKGGKKYTKRVDFPYGHPTRPISREDLLAKFRDCVAYSVKPLAASKIERVIEMTDKLDELEDVGKLVRLLG